MRSINVNVILGLAMAASLFTTNGYCMKRRGPDRLVYVRLADGSTVVERESEVNRYIEDHHAYVRSRASAALQSEWRQSSGSQRAPLSVPAELTTVEEIESYLKSPASQPWLRANPPVGAPGTQAVSESKAKEGDPSPAVTAQGTAGAGGGVKGSASASTAR